MLVEKLLHFETNSECLNFYIIGRKMEYLSMREQPEARRTELCRCMGVEVLWWQPSHSTVPTWTYRESFPFDG